MIQTHDQHLIMICVAYLFQLCIQHYCYLYKLKNKNVLTNDVIYSLKYITFVIKTIYSATKQYFIFILKLSI